MFGPSEAGPGVRESFEQICRRAGITLVYPADLPDLCCGTPWRSKGMKDGYAAMTGRVLPALWAASRQGELPVVCDASSCTEGLRQMLESELAAAGTGYAAMRIVDAVEFTAQQVLPRLGMRQEGSFAGPASDLFVDPDGDERRAARGRRGGRARP